MSPPSHDGGLCCWPWLALPSGNSGCLESWFAESPFPGLTPRPIASVYILSAEHGCTAGEERRWRVNPPLCAPNPRAPGEHRIQRLKSQTETRLGLLMRSQRRAAKLNSHCGGAVPRVLLAPAIPPWLQLQLFWQAGN